MNENSESEKTYRRLLGALATGSVDDIENVLRQESSFKGGHRCRTLFTKAVETNNLEAIACLLHHGIVPEEESPIFCAILNVDALRLLLSKKYSLDVTSSTGKRPLHVAVSVNSDAVPVLLDAGCDVTARDTVHGNTPLHVACAQLKEDAVLRLIQAGAWLNAENLRGETPLHALLKHACCANKNFHSRSRQTLARSLVNIGMRLASQTGKVNHKVVQVSEHILRTNRHVTSLQHLCRMAVREHCEVKAKVRGQSLVSIFEELEMSLYLKDYLLFRPLVFDRTI